MPSTNASNMVTVNTNISDMVCGNTMDWPNKEKLSELSTSCAIRVPKELVKPVALKEEATTATAINNNMMRDACKPALLRALISKNGLLRTSGPINATSNNEITAKMPAAVTEK